MKIESIRIKNYKSLQNVEIKNISNMSVFLGRNGVGKTTLFDVFGFLHDALQNNVKEALNRRGGFEQVISREQEGAIEFEIKFRESKDDPLVTYMLHINLKDGTPAIALEKLRYKLGSRGAPWLFLDFAYGKGIAIVNEDSFKEAYKAKTGEKPEREEQELDSPDILAIKGLGQFQRFKQIASFRKLIENWFVSDFHINEARLIPEAGYSEHLSRTGDNLALVAKYMYENQPKLFKRLLNKMQKRIPGISKVESSQTIDGRVILKFQDGSFKDPFISRYVSDGTIKMFAYLLLLYDPNPHPLLCIEEPENQLYPHLLQELAEEFREYGSKGGQVFVSTHSPDFVNSIKLKELFIMRKKDDGFTEIICAKDMELICNLVAEGDELGELWKQGFFDNIEGLQ